MQEMSKFVYAFKNGKWRKASKTEDKTRLACTSTQASTQQNNQKRKPGQEYCVESV